MKSTPIKNTLATCIVLLLVVSCQFQHNNSLFQVAKDGNIDVAERLVKNCESVNQTSSQLQSPLHIAAEYGRDDMVAWLLAHDADPTIIDKEGKTAYDSALVAGNINAAFIISNFVGTLEKEKLLYTQGKIELLEVTLLAQDYRKLDLLHYLAQVGDIDKLQTRIDEVKDINPQTESGQTPLHFAVINRQLRAMSLLLQNGANPNIGDISNKTPLYYAVEIEDIDAIHSLLMYGADPLISTFCKEENSVELARQIRNQEIISALRQK